MKQLAIPLAPQQQAGQTGAADQTGGCSTPTEADGQLRLLWQTDAGCAHAGEMRGEYIARSGPESGDGHVAQRTPQTCRHQQVRPNSL